MADSTQTQFVDDVATQTGLDPRVLTAWIAAEGAYAPNGTGGYNYLNLRPAAGDTGVASQSSGGFDQFASLQSAETSTINRIKQPFLWGILEPVLATSGDTPQQQINAIAASTWDGSGHYGGTGGPQITSQFLPQSALNQAAQTGSLTIQDINAMGGSANDTYPGESTVNSLEGSLSGPLTSIEGAVSFLFSYRFLEILGGGILVIVGLIALAREVGVNVPGAQIAQTVIPGAAAVTKASGARGG